VSEELLDIKAELVKTNTYLVETPVKLNENIHNLISASSCFVDIYNDIFWFCGNIM